MALVHMAMRALAPLLQAGRVQAPAGPVQLLHMSTGAAVSKSDVVHLLDAREDPDVDAAVRSYQQQAFKAGKTAPEQADDVPELTAQLQKKYIAAQIVESGIQNISVPLSNSSTAAVKRYVQQLVGLGSKAGFEDPMQEVSKRVKQSAAGCVTVRELLTEIKSLASPDFHAALLEALAQVEAKSGPVMLDGSSAAYKAFQAQVKAVSAEHKLPVQLLSSARSSASSAEMAAWVQAARAADAQSELEALKSEATALLDKHLSKSAEQIRKDQAAAVATLQRKIEAAKGASWAQAFAKDLEAIAAFDAAVAADPVNGPKVAVA